MSSTLFGRGTTGQVGSMHRVETIQREIAELRQLLTDVKQVPDLVKELTEQVRGLHARLDALNVPQLAPAVSQSQFDELESRVEALRVLQSSMVTPAMLSALERRLKSAAER